MHSWLPKKTIFKKTLEADCGRESILLLLLSIPLSGDTDIDFLVYVSTNPSGLERVAAKAKTQALAHTMHQKVS